MEFLRKHTYYPNQLIAFVGFLLTSSTLYFYPIQLVQEQPQIPTGYKLTLGIFLFVIILGSYLQYLFSEKCHIMLEISEYILYPMMILNLLLIKFPEQIKEDFESIAFIIIFLLSLATMAILIHKIINVNQLHTSYPNLELLSFKKYPRIYRVIKLIVFSYFLNLGEFSSNKFIFIFLNVIELGLIGRYFTFTNIDAEYGVITAGLGNFVGCLFVLLDDSSYAISNLLVDFCIFIAYFMKVNMLRIMIEMKVLQRLEERNSEDSLITEVENQILFLECFRKVIKNKDKQYSEQFQSFFKVKYFQQLLETVLEQKKTLSYFHKLSSRNQNVASSLKTLFEILSDNVKAPQILSANDIIYSEQIFQNYILSFYKNANIELDPIKQSICEYFISYSSQIDPKFIQYNLVKFCLKLNKSNSFIEKVRQKKIRKYLQFFASEKDQCDISKKLMKFEFEISFFREKLLEFCETDFQLIESLRGKINQPSLIEEYLVTRADQKKIVNKFLTQKMKNSINFITSPQFLYLFMIYKIGFCKSVEVTSQEIFQKIIVPRLHHQLSENSKKDNPTILIEGCSTSQRKFEHLALTNKIFRQTFHCDGVDCNKITISRLIPLQHREQHYHLMIKAENGSYDFDEHKNHTCLLKYNLNDQKIHLLAKFRVSVSIFSFEYKSILYLCQFEREDNGSYLNTKFLKIEDLKQNGSSRQIVRYIQYIQENKPQIENYYQFNKNTPIIKIDTSGLELNYQTYIGQQCQEVDSLEDFTGSEQIFPFQINPEKKRIKTLEEEIVKSNSKASKISIKKIVIILFACLVLLLTIIPVEISHSKFKEINKLLDSSLNYLEKIHNSDYKVGWNLMILYGIRREIFSDRTCQPSLGITNLSAAKQVQLNETAQNISNFLLTTYDPRVTLETFRDIFFRKNRTFWNIGLQDKKTITEAEYLYQLKYLNSDFRSKLSNIELFSPNTLLQLYPSIQSVIDYLTNPSSNVNFTYQMIDQIGNQILNRKQLFLEMFIFVLSIVCVSVCIFGIAMKKTFEENYEMIDLFLRNWEWKSLYRRSVIRKLKKEIKQIEGRALQSIQFNRNGILKITRSQKKAITTKTLKLEQFDEPISNQSLKKITNKLEKKCQNYGLKRYLPLRYILKHKKWSFIALLAGLLIIFSIFSVVFLQMIDLSRAKLETFEAIKSIEKMKEVFYIYETAEWMQFSNLVSFRDLDKFNQIIAYADKLKPEANYLNEIKSIQGNPSTKQIHSISICDLLSCNSNSPDVGDQKLIQVIPALYKHENIVKKMINENNADPNNIQNILCKNMQTLMHYVEPAISKLNRLLYVDLCVKNDQIINLKIASNMIAIGIGTIIALYLGYLILSKSSKIQKQVLSFDKVSNLHHLEDYKPYFNRYLNPEK